MARAMKAASGKGKAAAAEAANAAFEDNLDTVVALGWANVDRTAFEVFMEEVGAHVPTPPSQS